VTPALSSSKFLQEGVLTPDEFVQAGDLLVYRCATWSWEAGDPQRKVAYLPPEKQFLITRNVPCPMRAESLQNSVKSEKDVDVEIEDDEGGWVAPQMDDDVKDVKDIKEETITATKKNDDDDDGDDENIPEMENWHEENLIADDPSVLPPSQEEDNILKTRTYDLSITYDKYYQTPRVWLFGYDENRQPLKPEEVFADISQDHAQKTVTIDTHPHLGIPSAYIHPCRHASVMKKILQRLAENGKELRVDQYLFLFLKFISAVIPTIEYDNTIAMEG